MNDKISKIDKNFIAETIDDREVLFFNVKGEPFKIYGLYESEKEDEFFRIPPDVAKNVSEGVEMLNQNTSGGRVRFKTDSDLIALHVFNKSFNIMPHMTIMGSSSFDLYEKTEEGYFYLGSFHPGWDFTEKKITEFTSVLKLNGKKMRDLTINFPLYNGFEKLLIGVDKDADLEKGDTYKNIPPVIYYGSSITQGGCASRPGNNYANILSRWYDTDFYNYGFSGNAKGEPEIANFIADRDMSVFVYAYDHNAPTSEHLQKTHEAMYKTIRKKHPDIPCVFITRPKPRYTEEEVTRREIVLNTYNNAKSRGENVYFIDGEKISDILGGDSITVDGCHPNDLGFMDIAVAVNEVFKKIFK